MKRLFITVMMTMIVLCMISVASGKEVSIPVTLELSNGRQIEAVLEQGQDYFNIRGTSLGGITIAIDKIKEIILFSKMGCGPFGPLPCEYRLAVVLSNGEKLEGVSHGKYIGTLRSSLYGKIDIDTYPLHIYFRGKPAE